MMPPTCAATNPAIAPWLQAWLSWAESRVVRRRHMRALVFICLLFVSGAAGGCSRSGDLGGFLAQGSLNVAGTRRRTPHLESSTQSGSSNVTRTVSRLPSAAHLSRLLTHSCNKRSAHLRFRLI